MVLHPEVQKRAQADIDQIAQNRLPTLDDYDALPYVTAIIKESARWGPTVPLGLPHRLMEDDVYENYFIPGGSTVFANIWCVITIHFHASLDNWTGLSRTMKRCILIRSSLIPPATSVTTRSSIRSNLPLVWEGGPVPAHIWLR
jgi:hypothetical protein